MNCHPVFGCSGHNHTGNDLELSNLLIKSITLEYIGESLLPLENRLDDIDTELGKIPLVNGKIPDTKVSTADGSTQNLKNAEYSLELSKQKLDTGITATAKSGGVERQLSEKLQDIVFAQDFGAFGTGLVDDTVALQKAIDAQAGSTLYLRKGIYLISDTIYIPRGTAIIGLGASDAWSGRTRGAIIRTTGSGVKRIWTDQGEVTRPYNSTWLDLLDTPISVAVVTEGDSDIYNIILDGGSDTTNVFDVGFFNPSCKRVNMNNVDTSGYFNLTGMYFCATWTHHKNKPLYQLHANTYREVLSDGALNECTFTNCYLDGGNIGFYGKGIERDPSKAYAGGTNDLIWSYGGASDLTCTGVRFGNTPLGDGLKAGLYLDFGWSQLTKGRDYKYFQNHNFVGCSARTSDARYACVLDRTRSDSFFGFYAETHGEYLSKAMSISMIGLPTKMISPTQWVATDGRTVKFKIPGNDQFRVGTTDWCVGATIRGGTSGATFRVRAIGFDRTNRYFMTRPSDISGTFVSGETLIQDGNQSIASPLVSNSNTQDTIQIGQSSFCTAALSCSMTGTYANFSRLRAGASRFDENALYLRGGEGDEESRKASLTMYSSGNTELAARKITLVGGDSATADRTATVSVLDTGGVTIESPTTHVTSTDVTQVGGSIVNIGSTTTQLNLYANGLTNNTGNRLRWHGDYFAPYDDGVPNLGANGKRWNSVHIKNNIKLNSPDGSRWVITVSDLGELSVVKG